MLLTYGDCSKLKGKEWCVLEVRSEKTIEPTLRRIGKAIPMIFRDDAVELFVPVGKRDLDQFDLEAGPYLLVRSTSFPGLLRLKTITGVVSLVTEGDCNRPSKVIKWDDPSVQTLIKTAEKRFYEHSTGVTVGSFVRVLNGETRDYCGTVTAMADGKAMVRIALKTKSILLETPVLNLLNLDHTPKHLRAYYYCPLVLNLTEDGGEHSHLVENDAKLVQYALPAPPRPQVKHEAPKRARQRTVTALVRKLILVDKVQKPLVIAAKVMDGIKTDEVKAPKNLFIVYTIIKDSLMEHYIKKEHPNLLSYREVVRVLGDDYRFSAKDIAKLGPGIRIPLGSKGK